jgi:hypothetical protein
MRKFSKIIESKESDISKSIEDIFIEFKDMGFNIEIKEIESHFSISLTCHEKVDNMVCVRDLAVADKRMDVLDLEYVSSKYIILGSLYSNGDKSSRIELKYRLIGSTPKEDDIKTWNQFKLYCENVLGIDGIYSDDFRIEVFGKHNWLDSCPDNYEGFYIDYGQDISDTEEEREEKKSKIIDKYPRYKEFFNKYLDYYVDWNLMHKQGEWKTRVDKVKPKFYPIPFNKEGIEVVKKLIEITN